MKSSNENLKHLQAYKLAKKMQENHHLTLNDLSEFSEPVVNYINANRSKLMMLFSDGSFLALDRSEVSETNEIVIKIIDPLSVIKIIEDDLINNKKSPLQ